MGVDQMSDKVKARVAYGWMAALLLLITAAMLWTFPQVYDVLAERLTALFGLEAASSEATEQTEGTEHWINNTLKWVAGVLFWWRAVKVLVLHGSPFPFWMEVSSGRQDNNGTGGRLATLVHIGDDNTGVLHHGDFWFGAVFRAHPASDKIMRSRLALLIAAIPLFRRSLVVEESRVFLLKHTHEDRAEYFRSRSDRYLQSTEGMKPGAFRREIARSAKAMERYFNAQTQEKRIDGLTWRWIIGGMCRISDAFGNRMEYFKTEGGKYCVKGPLNENEEIVDTIDEVRQLATTRLNPV